VKPFLLVLSSPSGGGKTTIARHLLGAREDLGYSVSATTRAPRPGETDGEHYHFLSAREFARREAAGAFVETATYGGARYGTLRAEVEKILAAGRHVVLDIEVEGARQVRRAYPDAVEVFILPPSARTLLERLGARNTEGTAALAGRLDHAAAELAAAPEYDYVVVNDDLVTAVDEVAAIIDAESRRVRRTPDLPGTLARLRDELQAHRERMHAATPRKES
jgi:guanylate kinase